MDIPAAMLSQAKTFCAIQPCSRFAEGDLVIEDASGKQEIPVCGRHHEYYMRYFGGPDVDPDIVKKETVFTDDVPDDDMLTDISRRGYVHELVRP